MSESGAWVHEVEQWQQFWQSLPKLKRMAWINRMVLNGSLNEQEESFRERCAVLLEQLGDSDD